MKIQRIFSALFLAIALILSNFSIAFAFPPQPSGFFGIVKLDDANVPVGTIISARVNGIQYAATAAALSSGNTWYVNLKVPGDDTTTPEIEGGAPGDTVVFYIGSYMADQSAFWVAGTNIRLDLTAATNHAPVADAQSVVTDEDVAKDITLTSTDADGNPLTYAIVTPPTHGLLSGVGPNVTYTPAANYNGPDFFTFKVNDGTVDSAPATVSISVTAVDDVPVANNQSVGANEDTAKDITLTGTDADGDILTFSVVTMPSHGSFDGTTYTPFTDFYGPDEFTFKSNDGTSDSNIATVSITVNAINDLPNAVNDTDQTTEGALVTIDVLANDTDVDEDVLSVISVGTPAHGAVIINTDNTLGYTPVPLFHGSDEFTYTVSDGNGGNDTATVFIEIGAVNDAPTAGNDAYVTDEDTQLNVSAPGLLANDSDPDGDAITAVLISSTTHGTLTLNADGSFNYAPDPSWHGTDSFTYNASDGILDSNIATVIITVNPTNDAPITSNDAYNTNEDTTLVIDLTGVLSNDSDVDGDPITAIKVTGPAHGALLFNANGSFTYTPDLNWHGADSFTYKANDGLLDSNIATVTITVNAVNDLPNAVDDNAQTIEGALVTKDVLANDTDVDGDILSVISVGTPAHGAVVINADNTLGYTPVPLFNGMDEFTYAISDGNGGIDTATVFIEIGAVNDAPTAGNDAYVTDEDTQLNISAPGLLANDSDPDGEAVTAVKVTDPAHGSLALSADGSFTYTPDLNWYGTDSFTYKASDGLLDSNETTVTITVGTINDAPIANTASVSVDEDAFLEIILTGSDVDGDTLTFSMVTPPANGSLSGTAPNLTYTPNANFHGTDSFIFEVSDNFLSGQAQVTITVNPINDAPVAVIDAYEISENAELNIAASGVLANDMDVDGDALTAVLVDDVLNGTLTFNTDGSFIYLPEANYNGSDSFTYKANDGTADSSVVIVTIKVNLVNYAPTAANEQYNGNEDTALAINPAGVLGNDIDGDGDPITAIKVTDPAHGVLVFNADGSFTYTPDLNWYGSDNFTYKATDGLLESNTAEVTLAFVSINDAPIADSQSVTTDEDMPKDLVLSSSDVDGDALTYSIGIAPVHGVLSGIAPNLTYTPNANFFGDDSFTFTVSDGQITSATATVNIKVDPISDAPICLSLELVTDEDASATLSPSCTDVDSTVLSYQIVELALHGTAALNADLLSYSPNSNYNGSDSFTYKASDGSLDSNAASVTVTVTPVNDAPVLVQPANQTNLVGEIVSLQLSASDPEGDVFTYAADGLPLGLSIDASTGLISGTLSYTSFGVYNITATVKINNVVADTKTFTWTVSDVLFTLTVNVVGNGNVMVTPSQAGYHYNDVVELTATPASGWTFVGWSGDLSGNTNPKSITINGNYVITATFEENSIPPTVLSIVRVNVNPTKAASVSFTVTFSEPVYGVDAADFNLNMVGVSGATISSVSGSGAVRTVVVNTGTGSGTLGLDLVDNNTIIDYTNNPLGGSGPTNGNFTGESYTVDKTVPVVSSIVRVNANPTKAASVSFTVTFSEPVYSVDAADFNLNMVGVSGATIASVSGSGATRTVVVNTGAGSGTLGLDLVDNNTIIDYLNNPLGGSGPANGNFTGESYTVDKTVPVVSLIVRASTSPTKATSVSFTVTFSEPVYGVDAADFNLNMVGVSGATIASVGGSGATRTVVVNTGAGSGTLGLDLVDNNTIIDYVSNPLGGSGPTNGNFTGQTFTVDKTVPVVSSIVRASTSPTKATSVSFTVTFSEPVYSVDAADFNLNMVGVSGATIAGVSGSGATRTVIVNTGAGSGTLGLDLVDNNTIIDYVSNPLGGSGPTNGNFTGQTFTVDKTVPMVSSIVRASTSPTKATSVSFTVTFSEPVYGVDAADFNLNMVGVSGATIASVSGSGATRTVVVNTGSGSGTLGLDLVDNNTIIDYVSNPLGGSGPTNGNFTGQTYTVDKTMPVVSSIVRVNPNPTALASVSFTVTFSEPVYGVDAADFNLNMVGVSGATITSVSGGGATRTVVVNTGTGSGTLGLDLVDNNTIIDYVSNPLGGSGPGNGNFTGEIYAVR